MVYLGLLCLSRAMSELPSLRHPRPTRVYRMPPITTRIPIDWIEDRAFAIEMRSCQLDPAAVARGPGWNSNCRERFYARIAWHRDKQNPSISRSNRATF